MARDKFEDLRSIRERPQDDYLPNLQEMFSFGGALPPLMAQTAPLKGPMPEAPRKPFPSRSREPTTREMERMFTPPYLRNQGGGDAELPPSLNVPMKRVVAPTAPGMVPIPEGFTLVSEG